MPDTPQRWIAILGAQDEPTDALDDYCHLLVDALQPKGRPLEISRIRWPQMGWRRALKEFRQHSAPKRGDWALLQYTPLSWSRRGFPVRFVGAIRYLKRIGMNVAVVFHDPHPFGGHRLRDRVRRSVQSTVMRRGAQLADRVITTIPIEHVPWLQTEEMRAKVTWVPAGSNISAVLWHGASREREAPTIAVFNISVGLQDEATIARVVLLASEQIGPLRLVVFGRGAKGAEAALRTSFEGAQVDLEVFDLVSSDKAGALLASSDVQLFIRAGISCRRGSAIAAIACGLPIVGLADSDTSHHITEAGVCLVPVGDTDGLVRELVRVLRDKALREALSQRSLKAARQYFAWDRIAERYLSAIR